METVVVVPIAREGEGIGAEVGPSLNGGGESAHLLPSQTISLSSSSSTASTISGNSSPEGFNIVSEATNFSLAIKSLKEQLALAQQKVAELNSENIKQNAKLLEAADLIAEQQRQLDGRFAFSFGQEAGEDENIGGGAGEADLRELKNLVAQERKQRVEVEEKFAKFKNSVKSMNEEYSQFFEEVKEHLIEQNERNSIKERFDQVSKCMHDRLQKHVKEQLALKTTIKQMNQVIQNMMKVIELQKLKPVSKATTKPLANNIKVPLPLPKTNVEVGLKTVPKQPIKVTKVEQSTVPPTPPQAPPKKPVVVEHAEDTSKSLRGFFCICGSEYSSRSNLVIHIRSFTEEGKFKCQICHEKFVLFYMLRRHLQSKHNIEPKKGGGAHIVGCMDCGKTFSSSANLWKHRKSEHSRGSKRNHNQNTSLTPTKTPAPPPPSEDSNDSVQFIEEHFDELSDPDNPNLRNGQPSNSEVSSPATSPTRFVTPKITKVSSEPVSISGKKHGMNIAKRHQGFFCICGIKFISRKSLDGHVQFQNKQHTDSTLTSSSSLPVSKLGPNHKVNPLKPLQCICGFRSVSKYNTAKHVMYYTTERKFVCDICSKRFLNMGYLREHYSRSHKLSKSIALGHGCRKCGISFESMKEFHEHSRTIHGFGVTPNKPVNEENGTPQASTSSASLSTPVVSKFRRTSLPASRPGKGPTITGVRGSLGGVTSPNKQSSPVDSFPLTSVEKKFGCVICGGAFTRVYDLHRHLRNIHDADPTNFPIGCPDCDSTFRTRQNFIRHRVSVHNSTIERKRQLKVDKISMTESPSSSGSSVPIPIFNIDDDDDDDEDFYESHPLSPEPIPIAYDFENDDDDEMSAMPKLEPTAAVPMPVETEYEEEEMDDEEDVPPTDTMVDIHELDMTKRGKGFHCTCGVKFVSKKNFKTHIKQKTQEWNFECKICKKKFFYNSYLRAHMLKTHKITVAGSEDAKIGCVYCGSTFETFYDLRQHQKAEHNDKAENDGGVMQQSMSSETASPSPGKPSRQPPKLTTIASTITNLSHAYDTEKLKHGLFYCVCGKNCSNKKSLQAHITYNKRDRKFPCTICGSRFPFQSFLSQHMERTHKINRSDVVEPRPTHSVKRQSRCTRCGKNFKTQVELFRHNKVFHKMGNFRQAARSRMSNQKIINISRNSPHHQVSSSSSDKYACACGFKYAQKSSLLKHIAKKSRGKIFKCPQCPKAFMEASGLRTHSEGVHRIDMKGKHHGCGICGELFKSMNDRIRHRIQIHHVRR